MKVTKVWVHEYTSGKLLGFADVQFSLDDTSESHMTWRGFKLFQGKEGDVQIGLPQRKDEKGELDDNGKVKWHPVITIQREDDGGPGADFYEYIRSEVEAAYQSFKKNSGDHTNSTPKSSSAQAGNAGIDPDDLPF